MHRGCPPVHPSVCRQNVKTRFSQKVSNVEVWSLLTTYRKSTRAFHRTHYLTPKIQPSKPATSFGPSRRGSSWDVVTLSSLGGLNDVNSIYSRAILRHSTICLRWHSVKELCKVEKVGSVGSCFVYC